MGMEIGYGNRSSGIWRTRGGDGYNGVGGTIGIDKGKLIVRLVLGGVDILFIFDFIVIKVDNLFFSLDWGLAIIGINIR